MARRRWYLPAEHDPRERSWRNVPPKLLRTSEHGCQALICSQDEDNENYITRIAGEPYHVILHLVYSHSGEERRFFTSRVDYFPRIDPILLRSSTSVIREA